MFIMSCNKWFSVLIIFNAALLVHCTNVWSTKQLFPANKIPDNGFSTNRSIVQNKIVQYHNFFRRKVIPTASNMLEMSWHPLAAEQAQRYAERCVFLEHNNASENNVPNLGNCGQNLFVAAQKTPWFFAIKSWFFEYRDFTYGSPDINLKAVGHYTQMVWATGHKIGCGVAFCPGGRWGQFYNYVCHYCPGGNYDGITQYPYKVGPPCGDCPDACVNGSLCANPCPVKDEWSNCEELRPVLHDICTRDTCKATCQCGSTKIHKNYPFK